MGTKLYEPITLILVVVTCVALAAGGYASWKYLGAKQDNATEEAAEEFIHDLSNVDIDLSPETPEKGEAQ